jgi:hypothetical protein
LYLIQPINLILTDTYGIYTNIATISENNFGIGFLTNMSAYDFIKNKKAGNNTGQLITG